MYLYLAFIKNLQLESGVWLCGIQRWEIRWVWLWWWKIWLTYKQFQVENVVLFVCQEALFFCLRGRTWCLFHLLLNAGSRCPFWVELVLAYASVPPAVALEAGWKAGGWTAHLTSLSSATSKLCSLLVPLIWHQGHSAYCSDLVLHLICSSCTLLMPFRRLIRLVLKNYL